LSKEIHPIIFLLNKITMPLMAALVLGYIYAIVVARSEFPQSIFVLLLVLGAIAFSLIIKGIIHSKSDRKLVESTDEPNS
jgi:hypothetical protein